MNAIDQLLLGALRGCNRWRFALRLRRHGPLACLYGRRRAGPLLVWLHGLGASKDQWGPAMFALAREYQCVFVDLPGHGQSLPQPNRGHGPHALLEAIEPILAAQGDRPLVLIGSSLGGCVAGLYAARHPQRVKGLVLMAPAGLGSTAMSAELVARVERGDGVFGYRNVVELQRFWQWLFVRPPRPGTRLLRALAASGRQRYEQIRQVVEECGVDGLQVLAERLPAIVCPTLVLWGAQDRVFLAEAMPPMLQRMARAEGQLIEQAGHVPYLEQGGQVRAAISRFLAPLAMEGAPCSR